MEGLDAATSEYNCVAEAAGEFLSGEQERRTVLSDFQVREFTKFLEENNPLMKEDEDGEEEEEFWEDLLVKVVSKKDGRVLWVSEEGKEQLEQEQALDAQATARARQQQLARREQQQAEAARRDRVSRFEQPEPVSAPTHV